MVTNATGYFVFDEGRIEIKRSPITGGGSALSLGETRNYSTVSTFSNVANNGPYRAGSNVTFTAHETIISSAVRLIGRSHLFSHEFQTTWTC